MKFIRRWLPCIALTLLATLLALLGFIQLQNAATALPDRFCYVNPQGLEARPVTEEEMKSPLISGYIMDGESLSFLLFSESVTTLDEAKTQLLPLVGTAAQNHILVFSHLSQMILQIGIIFWLLLIFCVVVSIYGVAIKLMEGFWKKQNPLNKTLLLAGLCAALIGVIWWDYAVWNVLEIPDTFLPSGFFFDIPYYFSRLAWALDGVNMAQQILGPLEVKAPLQEGAILLVGSLLVTLLAGLLVIRNTGRRVNSENLAEKKFWG